MYQLFGRKGWGSALTELQLAWYGLPYRLEEVGDLFASEAARQELAKINPVAQLPTLVLPARYSSDSIRLWRAEVAAGWDTERLPGWKVPERRKE